MSGVNDIGTPECCYQRVRHFVAERGNDDQIRPGTFGNRNYRDLQPLRGTHGRSHPYRADFEAQRDDAEQLG